MTIDSKSKEENTENHPKPGLKWHLVLLNSDEDNKMDCKNLWNISCKEQFLKRLFKLFDLNGDGEIQMKEFVAVLDRLECASVDTKWYFWIQEIFDVDSQDDRNITFEQFRKTLHLKESFFAKRFYAIFDTNGDSSINMKELVSGLTMLVQGTERETLKFLFDVYDIDGNGELNMNEVRTILECCVEESDINFDAAQIEDLVDVLKSLKCF
ncbi:NADPH oxidase 5 [Paramuricea clavata]|uniref:NADPH oxidase 5 n=1 Tax=Paramuricea clavata TaxID=317549 RepID=A0A6S7GJE8_PARCT|nr:NADPH oxidase 5 [Paramuricea clavata]